MSVVLTGVALCLLLLLLLFVLPLTVSFALLWDQGLSGHLGIGWANGFVHTRIPLGSDNDSRDVADSKRKDKTISKRPNTISVKKLLHNKPFRKRILRYLQDIWEAIEKRDITLLMRIGLADPADTGVLWSLLGPLSAILSTTRNSQISLQPDFLDSSFALQGKGTIRIVPLKIIYLTVRLLLSPTVWSGVIRARKR